MKSYKKYLIETLDMNDADADLFLSGFKTVNYNKGDYLLNEGDKCNIVRVILDGCARGFVVVDGKEITTNFYFENDHTYDYMKYLENQPAELNIQALNSIKTIELTLEALDFLSSDNIGFHRMSFNLFKINFLKLEKERQGFIIKSPKERYLDLLKYNKQIISRVPQHQVASYIGISPEHLSRIRKEIFTS